MTALAEPATLATAATGTHVADVVAGSGDAVTANISLKGVITLDCADGANADTLAEWVVIATVMTDVDNAAVFEFGGNSYVLHETVGADSLVQLTGAAGVTGIVLVSGVVAAAAGEIFVIQSHSEASTRLRVGVCRD